MRECYLEIVKVTKICGRALAVIAAFGGAAVSQASPPGQTITVCATGCNFTTVQAAIDSARSGDRVLIGTGLYREDITISEKSVALRGADSTRAVIKGSGTGAVMTLSCASPDTVVSISELTITGGNNQFETSGRGRGGGIANQGCTLQVNATLIEDNTAAGLGGGIWTSGPLVVWKSTIGHNRASNGGAIHSGSPTHVLFSNLESNEATCVVGAGGGGAIAGGADLVIKDSEFSNNITNASCRGIVSVSSGSNLSVARTNFVHNAGGPVLFNDGLADLRSVLMASNESAVFNGARGSVTLANSVVLNNRGPTGAIVNDGLMVIRDSTVGDNGGGGVAAVAGVDNRGTLNLIRTYITGNVSDSDVGGLLNVGGTVTNKNSTISDNIPTNCAGVDFACP